MLRSLYRAVMALGRPLLLRKLRRRGEQEPLYLHAVHQRFADYTPQEQQQAAAHAGAWVWIHAVSLGETRAAAILLQALRSVRPELKLLLTNGTATGHAEGAAHAAVAEDAGGHRLQEAQAPHATVAAIPLALAT